MDKYTDLKNQETELINEIDDLDNMLEDEMIDEDVYYEEIAMIHDDLKAVRDELKVTQPE